MHCTCAYQQVHYPDNSRAAHDACLVILFAIHALPRLPRTGLKTPPAIALLTAPVFDDSHLVWCLVLRTRPYVPSHFRP